MRTCCTRAPGLVHGGSKGGIHLIIAHPIHVQQPQWLGIGMLAGSVDAAWANMYHATHVKRRACSVKFTPESCRCMSAIVARKRAHVLHLQRCFRTTSGLTLVLAHHQNFEAHDAVGPVQAREGLTTMKPLCC